MDIPGEPPLETVFPGLSCDEYEETSDWSARYNCIAWAAGSDGEWWWPAPGYYWPRGVAREASLVATVAAFKTLGYVECSSGEVELGFEKIALYAVDDRLSHAARQLPDGKWTSKLGKRIDITHNSLECLHGKSYGHVGCFMKRPART